MLHRLFRPLLLIAAAFATLVFGGCSRDISGRYIHSQNSKDYIELKQDGSWVERQGRGGDAGTYIHFGTSLTLKGSRGYPRDGSLRGDTITFSNELGEWTKPGGAEGIKRNVMATVYALLFGGFTIYCLTLLFGTSAYIEREARRVGARSPGAVRAIGLFGALLLGAAGATITWYTLKEPLKSSTSDVSGE
jgi:hypothetical protein